MIKILLIKKIDNDNDFIMILPTRVAQLVRIDIGKCGLSKWYMVPSSNFATDDTLNLLGTGCCWVVSTSRIGSPWRVFRVWPWKVPQL